MKRFFHTLEIRFYRQNFGWGQFFHDVQWHPIEIVTRGYKHWIVIGFLWWQIDITWM